MTADEAWPISRLLNWTRDYLGKQGAESPRLDAEVLLAHVLGWHRVQLYTHFEQEIDPALRARFRDLIKKRAEGTPVAYLVGKKEFFSLTLQVSPAVLIPRPDSEFVVMEFLHVMKSKTRPVCVDVGTGSGALALASLSQHPTAQFFATDRSPEALSIARANAESLGLSGRISFHEGDLLEPVAGKGPFDVVLSNPPYIATAELETLEKGVRDYEPWLALDGGPDGLEVVHRLIEQAVPLLRPQGQLIIEIGTSQEAPVRESISRFPEMDLAPTIRDHAQHPRVIRATRLI